MKKILTTIPFALLTVIICLGQQPAKNEHVMTLLRADSLPISCNVEILKEGGRQVWVIRNGDERIRVTEMDERGDSVFFRMPVFESAFRLQRNAAGPVSGIWIKATSRQDVVQPVAFRPGTVRYPTDLGRAKYNVSGRWRVTFIRPDGSPLAAVAEFSQRGEKLTGTFLTPTGDYRYLEGVVTGDSLRLSCFDGSHAYFFGARIGERNRIGQGVFASGLTYRETWTAVKDPSAKIDESLSGMSLKAGEETLAFRFRDLDGNLLTLSDNRFRGKVVVIQIMGSWCPNCMDETAFLSRYYDNNRGRGVEMLALAFEYGTDTSRARKNLARLRDRYTVAYPILNTGVSSSDTLRTEKTLPELTPIKAFPTTIFIGRDGRVKKIHGGFAGPATGVHHEAYKREFEKTISDLLREDGSSPR